MDYAAALYLIVDLSWCDLCMYVCVCVSVLVGAECVCVWVSSLAAVNQPLSFWFVLDFFAFVCWRWWMDRNGGCVNDGGNESGGGGGGFDGVWLACPIQFGGTNTYR